MKKILILLAVILSLSPFSNANASEDAQLQQDPYFEIKEMTFKDVTDQYPVDLMSQPGLNEKCNEAQNLNGDPAPTPNPLDEADVILDKIINIGKKLWGLVLAGKPVHNVTLYTANALPTGINCWSSLSQWQAPQSRTYQVEYINGFGLPVVTYAFRVSFTAGGMHKGVGKYITNATIQTARLDVAWGYTFNANVQVPSVFNTGTIKSPVAGMQIEVNWNVETALKYSEQTETFYISGNNTITRMR